MKDKEMPPAEIIDSPYFGTFSDILRKCTKYTKQKYPTYEVPASAPIKVKKLFKEIVTSRKLFIKEDGTFDKSNYQTHAEHLIMQSTMYLSQKEQKMVLNIIKKFNSKLDKAFS